MDQIQQKSWNIFNDDCISQKDKLLALKIIKETCESKFSLIEKGPSVMALNSLQERVEKILVDTVREHATGVDMNSTHRPSIASSRP